MFREYFVVCDQSDDYSRGHMFSNLIEDSKKHILRVFPERQIYLRSGGEVSYHTLKTRTQVGVACFASLILLWCGFTVYNVFWGQSPLRSPSQQHLLTQAENQRLLEDAEARYENAQLQLTQQQESFERAARSFQEKHAAIAQFVSQPSTGAPFAILPPAASGSNGQVLMQPTVRDIAPRKARAATFKSASLDTGTSLDQPMGNLDQTQNVLLRSAELAMAEKIERNRAIIEATGLSINTILSSGLSGKGGPLLDLDGNADGDIEITDPRLAHVQARTREAQRLDEVMNSIPLGHPVAAEYYRTSSYGIRKDPFTKRPSMHHAVDFASFRMAPIVATADGTIKFEGFKGGYGRVVEIDHGHGFVTRYAHLAKSFVKRGQKVSKGDKIGGMGSTGRSTSTHLHYEVEFQGRATNPDNFLKAGQYVQQN